MEANEMTDKYDATNNYILSKYHFLSSRSHRSLYLYTKRLKRGMEIIALVALAIISYCRYT